MSVVGRPTAIVLLSIGAEGFGHHPLSSVAYRFVVNRTTLLPLHTHE